MIYNIVSWFCSTLLTLQHAWPLFTVLFNIGAKIYKHVGFWQNYSVNYLTIALFCRHQPNLPIVTHNQWPIGEPKTVCQLHYLTLLSKSEPQSVTIWSQDTLCKTIQEVRDHFLYLHNAISTMNDDCFFNIFTRQLHWFAGFVQ